MKEKISMVKLGDYIKEINKKTTVNNQYEVLTSSQNGIVSQQDYFNKQVASTDNVGYKIIKKGQFTYRSMSDTGKFYINQLKDKEIGIVSPAYPVFELINNELDSEYLALFFQSNEFQSQILTESTGTTRLALRYSKLENVRLNVPSKEKQQEIVSTIDKINSVIDADKRKLELLDEMVKSRFIEMFEGKYPTIKIGEKFTTTSGGTPLKSHKEYYDNGDIPWLTSGEVNSGIITSVKNRITKLGLEKSSAKLVPQNSVVVAMYGATAGKVGLLTIPSTTNQAVCSILPNDDYLPMFVYRAMEFKSEEMADRASGGAQPNISQGIVRDTEIYNAPLCVQKEFVSFAEQIDKSKFILQQQIKSLQELLDKKMDEYFGE